MKPPKGGFFFGSTEPHTPCSLRYISSYVTESQVKQSVIYQIRNVVNQKFYVGSTTNTRERFRTHRKRLRSNRHHCKHLQAAWNKYGEDCFKFEVMEVVLDGQSLQSVEDEWLSEYVGQPNCYNKSRYSDSPMRGIPKEQHPSFGRPKTDQERRAISTALKEFYAEDITNHPRFGKGHSEETKAKISSSRKGKMAGESHYRYGTVLSDEIKQKIGTTQRGKPKVAGRKVSAEGHAKIRTAAALGHYSHWKGKTHTAEAKAKLSKMVFAMPDGILFSSLTQALEHYDIKMPTLRRALVSGKPIAKGKLAGYRFEYAGMAQQTDMDRRLIALDPLHPQA